MYNLSAAMANKFVEAAVHMTETVKALGPNPLRTSNTHIPKECEA